MFSVGTSYEIKESRSGSIKIGLLLEPIIEYIISIVNDIKLGISDDIKKNAIIFHLVVRLNTIIELKCLKYKIKINSSDMIMEYLEILCIMIKYNKNTSELIKIINNIDFFLQGEERKVIQYTPRKKASFLRKSTSSIDDYDNILDINILSNMDIQRWKVVTKLLNRV